MTAGKPAIDVTPREILLAIGGGQEISLLHREWDGFVAGLGAALSDDRGPVVRPNIRQDPPPASAVSTAGPIMPVMALRNQRHVKLTNHLRRFGIEPSEITSDIEVLPYLAALAGEIDVPPVSTPGFCAREYGRLAQSLDAQSPIDLLRRARDVIPGMPVLWRNFERYALFLKECAAHAAVPDDAAISIYLGQSSARKDGDKGWSFLAVNAAGSVVGAKVGKRVRSTSHNLEMVAFVEAMTWAAGRRGVVVYTEVDIVEMGYNAWIDRWSAQRWRRGDGRKVKGSSAWMKLATLRRDGSALVRPVRDARDREMTARAARAAFEGKAAPVVDAGDDKPAKVVPIFLRSRRSHA